MRRNELHHATRVGLSPRSGFTLLEILAVVTILGILAGVVMPQFLSASGDAKLAASAATVNLIRKKIEYHAARGDVVLSAGGYPAEIDPGWFGSGLLPKHAWTGKPMILKVKDKPPDEVYPEDKTFDLTEADKKNTWYNTTNGAFCVLVPESLGDDAEIIEAFNLANSRTITDLEQTTY